MYTSPTCISPVQEVALFNQNWLVILDAHHQLALNQNFMGSEELNPPPSYTPQSTEAVVKIIITDQDMSVEFMQIIEGIISDFLGIT